MWANWDEVFIDQVLPYYEKPDYVAGMEPLYGIAHEYRMPGHLIAVYIPTQTTYYFLFETDIPKPSREWYVFNYLTREEFGGIKDAPTAWWEFLLDSVFAPIDWIGNQINDLLGLDLDPRLSVLGAAIVAAVAAEVAPLILDISNVSGLLGAVGEKLDKVWEAIAPLRREISELISDSKEAYVALGELSHLDELRTVDQILSLTWETYYEKKAEILGKIGNLSQELFGDVHVLNQWLGLAGMIWKDYATITGKTWDEQDREWLVRTNEFLSDLEKDLATYARHPERLWVRIEDALVKPIYEERGREYSRWDEFRADLKSRINSVDKLVRDVDRALYRYQHNLPDNIEKQLGPEIKQLRKDLREKYREGLGGYLDKVEARLELNDSTVRGIQRWRVAEGARVERNTRMLSDPKTLSAAEIDEQAAIFSGAQERISDALTQIALPVLDEIEMPRVTEAVLETFRSIE